jgi:hypothetical protein
MAVANRIMIDVPHDIPKTEVMLFAELLNRLRSLNVVWDMTIESMLDDGAGVRRSVEVIVYRDDQNNYKGIATTLAVWLKSEQKNVEFRILGAVEGA